MFIRELKNRSGSVSVQVISKSHGRYQVLKTVGFGRARHEIARLRTLARQEIERLESQPSLFPCESDELVEQAFSSLYNSNIRTVGPELVFGRIYDHTGFGCIKENLFRHLVISRLAFPLSKLKTAEYLYRYQGEAINVDRIYRFLDKLDGTLKPTVEQIAFIHTRRTLGDDISVVFYDMTTLYFEASDEDDLRKSCFSKDGEHGNPQIFIGLLASSGGYATGYDIFEGNTCEGHTLIPFPEKASNKFDLGKPVVVADSGLLSKPDIKVLEKNGYEYIIGARLKNQTAIIQEEIIRQAYTESACYTLKKSETTRLIVQYAGKRAKKDAYIGRRD